MWGASPWEMISSRGRASFNLERAYSLMAAVRSSRAESAETARTAAEKAAISKLLTTDAGKRVQDAQAEADVGAYVDHGLKVGVEARRPLSTLPIWKTRAAAVRPQGWPPPQRSP